MPQQARELLVQWRDAAAGVDQKQGKIGLVQGPFGLRAHARRQTAVFGILETRGVDDTKTEAIMEAAREAGATGGKILGAGELGAGVIAGRA